jgi:hypothetical protein
MVYRGSQRMRWIATTSPHASEVTDEDDFGEVEVDDDESNDQSLRPLAKRIKTDMCVSVVSSVC